MFFCEVVYRERLMKFKELRVLQYKSQSCGFFCRSKCVDFCTQVATLEMMWGREFRMFLVVCKTVKQSEEIGYALLNQSIFNILPHISCEEEC